MSISLDLKLFMTGIFCYHHPNHNLWWENPGAARSYSASAGLSSFHPSNNQLFFNVITLCKPSLIVWLHSSSPSSMHSLVFARKRWILLCMSWSTERWWSCEYEYNPFRPVSSKDCGFGLIYKVLWNHLKKHFWLSMDPAMRKISNKVKHTSVCHQDQCLMLKNRETSV